MGAKVSCGIGLMNFAMFYATPSFSLSKYYKKAPQDKKNAQMLIQGIGLSQFWSAAVLWGTLASGGVKKEHSLALAVGHFAFMGDQIKGLVTGMYDDLGVEINAFYFWIVVNLGLGACNLLA